MPSILFLIRKQSVMLDEGWNMSNWRTGVKYGDRGYLCFFILFFFLYVLPHIKHLKNPLLPAEDFLNVFYMCVFIPL